MNNVLKIASVGVIGVVAALALPLVFNKSTPSDEVKAVDSQAIPVSKKETAPEAKKIIKKLNVNLNRTILIYGEINGRTASVADQIRRLSKSSSDPIYLVLESPGGSVVDGSMIINAMETSNAPIITISKGLCASMCAMIHQYGSKRYMFDRSIIMFHQASAGTQGNIGQMNAFLGVLTKYIYRLEADVAKRQGLSLAEYQAKTASEYWLDSQDALAAKVSDGTVDFDVSALENPFTNPGEDKNKGTKTTITLPTYVETRLNTFKWIYKP